MQSEFQPFCVDFTLRSPMQVPRFPIMLDGLVYYMVQDLHGFDETQASSQQILAIVDDLLAKDQGIYKASSGILVRTSTQAITSGVAVHPTVMNWEDYNYRLPARKTLVTKSGPYRSRMGKYNTISLNAIRFYGVGDTDKLQFYLSSAFGLGKSVPQGYGEVGEMVLRPIQDDFSWIGNATGETLLHRHLPADIANQLPGFNVDDHDIDYRSMTPPYPLNELVPCYVFPKSLIVIDDNY